MEETKNNNEEILITDVGESSSSIQTPTPEVAPIQEPIVPQVEPTPEVAPIQEPVVPQVEPTPEVAPVLEPVTPQVEPTLEVASVLEPVTPKVEPTPEVASVLEPVTPQVEPTPEVAPIQEPVVPQVEPTPEVAPIQEPVVPQVEPTPEVAPVLEPVTPQVEPTPEVASVQEPVTPQVESTPEVAPVSETLVNSDTNTTPEPEKKSSVLKVILMILLILAIMAGAYYVYKEYFSKPVDKDDAQVLEKDHNKESEKEKLTEHFNGIFKKDDGEDQILIFQNTEKEGSLIFAEEVNVAGVKSLSYPIQLQSLEISENTMLYKEKEKEILKIEKSGNKIVISYLGLEEEKEKYENTIGSYTKTKEVTSYSIEEFKK